MYMHIDYAPIEDCKNDGSFGMICVKCNRCGRFDKKEGQETAEDIVNRLFKEEFEEVEE